jgi:protein-S-isoprenylcysteine O-methyltransferase Ste14
MTSHAERKAEGDAELRAGIRRRIIQVLVQISIQALVPFLAAGKLRWWEGWAYTGLLLAGLAFNAAFMLRLHPETVAERGRGTEAGNWRTWDKVIGVAAALLYLLVVYLVAGLDERFSWTEPLGLPLQIAAFVVWALGSGLFSWAMITNAYFSTAVRIQDDRGHAVCDSGPYRFVRHPGYVGACLQCLAAPIMLGSLWALIPGVLGILSLIARTALEDDMLQEELGGYQEYAGRVRYRLLPGVW